MRQAFARWRDTRTSHDPSPAERPPDPSANVAAEGEASSAVQPLVADRPIGSEEEDALERGGLVTAIVATVERAPATGLVVGLAGPWGEGKSSVLTMVADRLEARDSAKIVRFNPWMFSGSDELLPRFFSEMSTAVAIGSAPGQKAARALSALGSALSRLGPIPLLGDALEAGGTAAEGAATLLQAGTSLYDRQQEVARALAELDRPVVVIVDDIDRLRVQDEIAEMVRLIRLVGDLPRVTYLLAYEREEVARALGDGDVSRGDAYLEKIVQTTFELPATRRDLLDKLLTQAIDDAVGDLGQRRFDAGRFETLQLAGLRGLFRNVRDVRRFASALPAILAVIDDEVELSDVLAMEALRLLEPQVFALLAANADTMTKLGGGSDWLGNDRSDEQKQVVDEIISVARRPAVVSELLRELFPATARHLGGTTYSRSFASEWRRAGLVASSEVLLTYLERGLPQGAVSYGDVQQALAVLNDREQLEGLVGETDEDHLISLLSRLEDYEGRFELTQPEMTVEVLSRAVNRLRPRERRAFEYDGHIAVRRLLLRILRRRDKQAVADILDRVRWPNLSTRAEMVQRVGYHPNAGQRLVREDAAKRLEAELVDAILVASPEDLREEVDIAHLLRLAEGQEPQRFGKRAEELIEDQQLLTRWLAQAMLTKHTQDGLQHLLPWSKLVENVDPERLTDAVRALSASPALARSEREEEAVRQAQHYSINPEQAEDDVRAFWGEDFEEV